jgi:hypothetical protein
VHIRILTAAAVAFILGAVTMLLGLYAFSAHGRAIQSLQDENNLLRESVKTMELERAEIKSLLKLDGKVSSDVGAQRMVNHRTGILSECRSVSDCTVKLPNGEEVRAIMDAPSLREEHGRVYGITLGGSVRITGTEPPFKIIWIEQPPD